MKKLFKNITHELNLDIDIVEIDKIIREYVKNTNRVQEWRFEGQSYTIKSKRIDWFGCPPLPIYTIIIHLMDKGDSRGLLIRIRGNVLYDLFIYIGFVVFFGSFISYFFIDFEEDYFFFLFFTFGVCLMLIMLGFINHQNRREGEGEFLKLKRHLEDTVGLNVEKKTTTGLV